MDHWSLRESKMIHSWKRKDQRIWTNALCLWLALLALRFSRVLARWTQPRPRIQFMSTAQRLTAPLTWLTITITSNSGTLRRWSMEAPNSLKYLGMRRISGSTLRLTRRTPLLAAKWRFLLTQRKLPRNRRHPYLRMEIKRIIQAIISPTTTITSCVIFVRIWTSASSSISQPIESTFWRL